VTIDWTAIWNAFKDLAGPGALLFVIATGLIKQRADHSKSQDDDTHIKTQGEIDKEKRIADLAASEAAAATEERKTQAALTERLLIMLSASNDATRELTKSINVSADAQKVSNGIEADRLVSHDKAEAAWRTSIQDLTAAVVGFQSSMTTTGQNISQGIAAAQSATIDAIGTKVDDMGTGINNKLDERLTETKASIDAMQATMEKFIETVQGMLPLPEHLTELKALIVNVSNDTKILKDELKVANDQITDLRTELAIEKNDGASSPAIDAIDASMKADDTAASDGPQ
jgi:hypothetical protein